MSDKSRKNIFIFTLIVPTFLLFCLFILYPMLNGIKYSFYLWSGLNNNTQFTGLSNYLKLFNDPAILKALYHDLYLAFFNIIATMLLSLLFAGILSMADIKFKGLTQGILFFPAVTSVVIVAIIWILAYNPSLGVINSILKSIGFNNSDIAWLGDSKLALNSVIFVKVWASVGFFVVIFVTALKGIPNDIGEAAFLDGAGKLRQYFKIYIPLIGEQINFAFIILLIGSINGTYQLIQLMTDGGPNQATEVLSTYLYRVGFNFQQFGYATTIGVLVLVVTLTINVLYDRFFSVQSYEY